MTIPIPTAARSSVLVAVAAALPLLIGSVAPATAAAASAERVPVIVQVSAGSDAAALARSAAGPAGSVSNVYRHALHGFAAALPAQAIRALRANPAVLTIEPDLPTELLGTQTPTPSWGLDRVDQAKLPLSSSFSWSAEGRGVTAYVIDSGVRADHVDLTGRVRAGFTAVSDGRGTTDCHGHGTHVAGTVGGTTYGVAKSATLVPVRVLGCDGSGTYSQIIAGLDYATKDHLPGTPAVATLSLGGPASSALDTAVQGLIKDGVSVAVAAGNANADACRTSPARVAAALTVGATTSTDTRASYSSFGACLDLFAPGSAIVSAWPSSTTSSATLSGTSMAAPHVAGAAALLLSQQPGLTPAAVADAITRSATTGIVLKAGWKSPNRLLRTPA